MINTKDWYLSKTLLANALLAVIGILMLISTTLTQNPALTVPGILALVAGCLNIVLRVFFTNTGINH